MGGTTDVETNEGRRWWRGAQESYRIKRCVSEPVIHIEHEAYLG